MTPKKGFGCQHCPFWYLHSSFNAALSSGKAKTPPNDKFSGKPCKVNTHYVGPDIPQARVDVLFVGEAPGGEEDAKGTPFVGRAGNLLRDCIKRAGIKNWAIANVVNCKTPNNKTPTFAEAAFCSGFLGALIHRLQPKFIVPLGTVAMQALTGDKGAGITKFVTQPECKANPFTLTVAGVSATVFPMLHPSYILRNDHMSGAYGIAFNRLQEIVTGAATTTRLAKKRNWRVLMKRQEVLDFLKRLKKEKKPASFDFETSCLDPFEMDATILCVGMSNTPGEGVTIPIDHSESPFKGDEEIVRAIVDVIEDPDIGVVIQNGAFDMRWAIVKWNARNIQLVGDPMLCSHALDEQRGRHSLDQQIIRELPDVPNYWAGSDEWIKEHGSFSSMPLHDLGIYCAGDADTEISLHYVYLEKLKEFPKLLRIATRVMPRGTQFITRMMLRGLRCDLPYLKELNTRMEEAIKDRNRTLLLDPQIREFSDEKTEQKREAEKERIAELKTESGRQRAMAKLHNVKYEFNFNSPVQVSEFLFEHLGHEPLKFTESEQASSDEETLKYITAQYDCPAAKAVLGLREFSKAKGTYAEPIYALASRKTKHTGYLHGSFHQTGTVTARLSSSSPNLQNIPSGGVGLSVKRGFISRFKGGFLFNGDMSQIELRLLAALSKDKDMMRVYLEGLPVKDLHLLTCCKIFGITPEEYEALDEVEKKHKRRIAKVVNFGVAYGSGGQGVQAALAKDGVYISDDDAQGYVEGFFAAYPGVAEYVERINLRLARDGYIETVFGRRRRLPEIESSEHAVRARAQRQALNATIQEPASTITLLAGIIIDESLKSAGFKSGEIATVHDSHTWDTVRSEFPDLFTVAKDVMENVPKYAHTVIGDDFNWEWAERVPLLAEFSVGWNWRDEAKIESPDGLDAALEQSAKFQSERDANPFGE